MIPAIRPFWLGLSISVPLILACVSPGLGRGNRATTKVTSAPAELNSLRSDSEIALGATDRRLPESLSSTASPTPVVDDASARATLAALSRLATARSTFEREQHVEEILAVLIVEDPRLAVEFALALDPGPLQNSVLGRAVEGFSAADMPGALRWLQTLSSSSLIEQALAGITQTLLSLDPAVMAHYVAQLPPGEQRNLLERTAAGRLANMDLPQAIAALERAATTPQSWQSFSQIVERWIDLDPAATLHYVSTRAESSDRSDLLRHLGMLVAQRDPDKALSLTVQLKDHAARLAYTAGLSEGFAQNDPASAADLLRALPVETLRAPWTGDFLNSWTSQNPLAAARWAENVPVGPEREHVVLRVAIQWASIDRDAARRWLAGVQPAQKHPSHPRAGEP